MPDLPIIPATLPSGFCPASYQDMWNTFAAFGSVPLPNLSGISIGPTPPDDRTRPWLQLDSSGNPTRIYYFANGAWLSRHTIQSGLTMWWFNVLPDFTTFDGGDNLTVDPTPTTGPMWQQALANDGETVIEAMFPVPAGTFHDPNTDEDVVLSEGDTGGEATHILTAAEANHFHGSGEAAAHLRMQFPVRAWSDSASVGSGTFLLPQTNIITSPAISSGNLGTSDSVDSPDAPSTPHNNMPQYIVGYLLQRTSKLFFSVPVV